MSYFGLSEFGVVSHESRTDEVVEVMGSRPAGLAVLFVWAVAASILAEDKFQAFVDIANKEAIESMTIELGIPSKGSGKLKAKADPVLNWSQKRNGYYGCKMHVWESGGRAMALSGTLHWPSNNQMVYEFINLSAEPMFAEFEGDVVWNGTQKDSVQWRLLPQEAAPAKSSKIRVAQMRALARKFTARAIKGAPQYEEGSRWELRLVPQPLYRYQPTSGDVVDGALFSFAQETDPEVILLLEARRNKAGKLSWYFGGARACAWELQLDYKKKRVWSVDRILGYPLRQGLGFYQFAKTVEYPEQ